MFAFLEILPPVEGKRRIRKERRIAPKSTAVLYSGTGRNKIYKITVQQRHDGREFENFCEKYAVIKGKLLAAENAKLPSQVRTMLYREDDYRRGLLARSAHDLISSSFFGNYKCHIGIIDPGGKFAKYAERFAPFAGRLDICTDRPEYYERFTEHLYQKYGLATVIRNDMKYLYAADAVICAERQIEQRIECKRLIAPEHFSGEQAIKLARVRTNYDRLIPNGLNPIAFAGALAELNGDETVKKSPACGYKLGNRIISRAAAIEYMTIT